MDERRPLIDRTVISINADGNVPAFMNDPRIQKTQRFKWAIPSQESEESLKDRYFSIRVCYVCMFLSAVSFTITISSMWPFLQIIDITTNTSFFGWIVAIFSLGQLISSPLFGFWANKISCHKIPMIVCLVISVFGNILYFYLQSTNQLTIMSPKYWMLVARFILGVGAACAAVIRSYASAATNMQERTATLANISACQGLGFIIGPVLQSALTPIGYPGVSESPYFHLNTYTSPAFLSIVIYICLIFIMLRFFNEYVVLETGNVQQVTSLSQTNTQSSLHSSYADSLKNLPPPDTTAIVLTLLLFFINCFVFSFYETLSSPLTIDMYAWTKEESVKYNGIILGTFGIFGVGVVLLTKHLTKTIKEKTLMTGAYVMLFLSIIALLPWGDDFPSIQIPTIEPGNRNTTTLPYWNTTTEIPTSTVPMTTAPVPRGCPLDYDWCYYTPIVQFYQYVLGCLLLMTAYSVANVMTFAIYSKLLGPKPQGTMMGILTSVGSLSRAIGPIVVSYLYGLYGPRVSFIILAVIVLKALLIIAFTYKRYEPYKFS